MIDQHRDELIQALKTASKALNEANLSVDACGCCGGPWLTLHDDISGSSYHFSLPTDDDRIEMAVDEIIKERDKASQKLGGVVLLSPSEVMQNLENFINDTSKDTENT